jgi:hypothetical protein
VKLRGFAVIAGLIIATIVVVDLSFVLLNSLYFSVYVLVGMTVLTMYIISNLPDCYLINRNCYSKEELDEFGKMQIQYPEDINGRHH